MSSFTVSAPAKVILFGEHAVVYSKPAIAAALSRRTFLHVHRASGTRELKLSFPDIQVEQCWHVDELLEKLPDSAFLKGDKVVFDPAILQVIETRLCKPGANPAVSAFLYLYLAIFRKKLPYLHVRVTSSIPVGSGLGSSAALSVCVAAALLSIKGVVNVADSPTLTAGAWPHSLRPHPEQLKHINDYAYVMEQVMHGTPSGIDNSVSTFGGAVLFTKGQPMQQLQSMPVLHILLTNTCVPGRNTKTLVAGVRERYNNPATQTYTSGLIDGIADVSQRGIPVLQELATHKTAGAHSAAQRSLEQLIDENRVLLRQLGVGHERLDLVQLLSEAHGFHSKLTGAGGGGCAITYLRDATSAPALQKDLEEHGFQCLVADVGCDGVLFHPKHTLSQVENYLHKSKM